MLPSERTLKETTVQKRRGLINVTEVQTDVRTTIYKPVIDSDGSPAYAGRATHVRENSRTYRINKVLLITVVIAFAAGLYLSKSEIARGFDVDQWQISQEFEDYSAEKRNVPFDENGFVFGNSSIEYLGEEDLKRIEEISKTIDYSYGDLIRFGINEIYARNGYAFKKDGKYDQHYSSYEWYQTMQKGKIGYEQLNLYEQKNIDLLVNLEKSIHN